MPKVARQLGRYHVLDRIAYGGMAEIFRALTFDQNGTPQLVAIKQVLPHYAEDREFIDMLVDEAKLVSMLHHPNIVQIYEVGHLDGVYYVAMEYVWGKDVRAVLERCRSRSARLPVEVSAYLLAEALAGLDSAHRLLDPNGNPAGLVHRDFSPSNILLSYNGDVKICDFGIAKATFSRIETKTGVIKGKVKYMSPEQAFGRKLDHRSDLFSAGSVLYEMLTADPPFLAKNEIDLIFMVRDAQITPPSKRTPGLPLEMEEIIYRAMARSRSARYQSAAEFKVALAGYLRHRGVGNWRAELTRFLASLYAKEYVKERQALSEYILDPTQIGPNLGQNLIADVLGHDAAYTKFNPYPTQATSIADAGDPAVHDASTRIFAVPEAGAPLAIVPIENQATVILQTPEALGQDQWEEPTDNWMRGMEPTGPTRAAPPHVGQRIGSAPPQLAPEPTGPTYAAPSPLGPRAGSSPPQLAPEPTGPTYAAPSPLGPRVGPSHAPVAPPPSPSPPPLVPKPLQAAPMPPQAPPPQATPPRTLSLWKPPPPAQLQSSAPKAPPPVRKTMRQVQTLSGQGVQVPPAPPPPKAPSARPFGDGLEDSALQTTPRIDARDTAPPQRAPEPFEGLSAQPAPAPGSETPKRADDTQPTSIATPGAKQELRNSVSVNDRNRDSS